jgi:hypothetical protein
MYGGGYAPLGQMPTFPGAGLFGIPYAPPIRPYTQFDFGVKDPMLGMMLNTFAAPYMNQMMTASGLMPGSMGGGNPYYRLRDRAFQEQMAQATAAMQGVEGQNLLNLYENVNVGMLGRPRQEVRDEAEPFRPWAESAASYMAVLAPQTLDKLGGPRGSAMVMANQLAIGSRWMRDPLTGQRGFEGETLAQLSKEIFRQNYENKIVPTMPITAGQFGEVFTEMAQRGMMPDVRADLQDPNMSQSDKLKRAGEKYSAQVGKYADTLKTVKEMFADMGRPDAPMGELFSALEAITQNTVGGQDPGKLKQNIQQLDALMRENRVTLEHVLQMQGTIGQGLRGMGMSSVHAQGITQGSLAYLSAFRESGAGVGGFGRMTAEEGVTNFANRNVGATRSREANRAAAVLRLGEAGMLDTSTPEGKEAEALRQALLTPNAQGTYEFNGQTKSVFFDDARNPELTRMLRGATRGQVSEQAIRDMGSYSKANERTLAQNPQVARLITQVRQPAEAGAMMATSLTNLIASQLERDKGLRLTKDERTQLAGISRAGVEALRTTDLDKPYEEAKKNAVTAMSAQLDNIPRIRELTKTMSVEDRWIFTQGLLGTQGIDSLDAAMAQRPMIGGGWRGLEPWRQAANPAVMRGQPLAMARAKADAITSSALGDLQDPSIIRRAVRAMDRLGQDPNDPQAMWRAMGQALSGMDADEVRTRISQDEGGTIGTEEWEETTVRGGKVETKKTKGTRAQRLEYDMRQQITDVQRAKAINNRLSDKGLGADETTKLEQELDQIQRRVGIRGTAMEATFGRAGIPLKEFQAMQEKRMAELEKELPEDLQKPSLETAKKKIGDLRTQQGMQPVHGQKWNETATQIKAAEEDLQRRTDKRTEVLQKSASGKDATDLQRRMADEAKARQGGGPGDWLNSLLGGLGFGGEKPTAIKEAAAKAPGNVTIKSPSSIKIEVAKISIRPNGTGEITFDGVRDVAIVDNEAAA